MALKVLYTHVAIILERVRQVDNKRLVAPQYYWLFVVIYSSNKAEWYCIVTRFTWIDWISGCIFSLYALYVGIVGSLTWFEQYNDNRLCECRSYLPDYVPYNRFIRCHYLPHLYWLCHQQTQDICVPPLFLWIRNSRAYRSPMRGHKVTGNSRFIDSRKLISNGWTWTSSLYIIWEHSAYTQKDLLG